MSFLAAMIIIFYLIVDIQVKNLTVLIIYTLLSSVILGATGMIAGLWAEKFDQLASISNFVI